MVTNIALATMIEVRRMFDGMWVQIRFPGELAWVSALEWKRKMGRQSTWNIIVLRTIMEV